MKIRLTRNIKEGDENSIDSLTQLTEKCLDAEATEITVDDFLSLFYFDEIEKVINIILSKLRLGGTITFSDYDFELLAHQLDTGAINIEVLNMMFQGKNIRSFVSLDLVESILNKFGIKIIEKGIYEKSLFILKGIRC